MLETQAPAAGYNLRDRDLIFAEPPTQYVLRFKDIPDDERPRERLLSFGAANLSVAELMAIIWVNGSKKEDVLSMSRRTLKEYGDKTISHELNPRHLSEVADIPLVKACQIIASFELGRRFYSKQAGRAAYVRNAKQAFQYLKAMGQGRKEQLRGLYLNSRYQVIRDEVISVGSLTSNIVHPREVFQPAIEHGAIALILAHNHPSGRLEPTLADIQITEQLITAGQVLGIDLLDHLIITSGKYISVMECIQHD